MQTEENMMMNTEKKNEVILMSALLVLAGTLAVISYLVGTQLVSFGLQVITLIQQSAGLTFGDVMSALFQTFGIKMLMPILAIAVWYVVALHMSGASHKLWKKAAFIVSGVSLVLCAIMLGLTWETFADLPMVLVIAIPAIVVAVYASLKSKTEDEITKEMVEAVDIRISTASKPSKTRRTKTKRAEQKNRPYRRYL